MVQRLVLRFLMILTIIIFVRVAYAQQTTGGTVKYQPIAASPVWSYLRPGTPEVAGVRHLVLIYAGGRSRVAWDAENLLPYVAYVNRQGKPQDWLFDSFLWIEYATNDGVLLHLPTKGKRAITVADWQWLLDAFLDPAHGVGQLEACVKAAANHLQGKDHQVNLVITMPTPLTISKTFGTVTTDGPSLDFSRDADRLTALQWYIRATMERLKKLNARHVRLVGFYWLAETIPPQDYAIVKQTSDFLHTLGMKLYWIPYFSAGGLSVWRQLGIDATILQPNYFQNTEIQSARLNVAALRALRAGSGVELEVDGRAITKPEFRQRYTDYLDAGVKYGFMDHALLGYYEGGGTLRQFAASKDAQIRDLYDQTYRFVKGTYRPLGNTPLASLDALPPPRSPENLALVARGAKITGDFLRRPGLEAERLIDGNWPSYSGSNGFAAFYWPGHFTIELPRIHTISRTDVLLWDLDDRTFRYQIEISTNGQDWQRVADKSQVESHSWQTDRFVPTPARFVRFQGLHNSANSLFQVVKLEVYQ